MAPVYPELSALDGAAGENPVFGLVIVANGVGFRKQLASYQLSGDPGDLGDVIRSSDSFSLPYVCHSLISP